MMGVEPGAGEEASPGGDGGSPSPGPVCAEMSGNHGVKEAEPMTTAHEVAEALGVAIAMNGGPGVVWAPRAYAAFREFAGEAAG
jgi:hypothetical protein